ncbi:MAG: hypothetical protein KDD35_00615, partial [Bdellovibrionales bacterium]|nr:hypothetical protein [Bdellovibrionales bacterium]
MNIDRTIDIFSSRFEIESFLVPLVGLLVIFMSFSCTREKPSTTKIKLELPQYIASTSSAYSKALKNKVGVQSNDDWGLADPTSISEVACYALFVGGPGLDLNSCKNSAGVEVV